MWIRFNSKNNKFLLKSEDAKGKTYEISVVNNMWTHMIDAEGKIFVDGKELKE